MFSSRITATARHFAISCATARDQAGLVRQLAQTPADLLLLDLDAPNLDLPAIVAAAREHCPAVQIIAFLPHVRADLAEAARAAGVEKILARSAFVNQLPAIFENLAQKTT